MRTTVAGVIGIMVLAPGVASTQTPAPPPPAAPVAAPAPQTIAVGATIFYDYTWTTAPRTLDAAGQSVRLGAFNVARTYINVTGRVSPLVSFRITPDVTRESGSGGTLDGSMSVRLKFGYAQFALDRWTGRFRNAWVRVGMQQTPFLDGQDSVYRYRFQGQPYGERDGGLASADTGVTFHADLPNNYGDIHGGLYNGEGFTRAETNEQKAFMFRATVRPAPTGPATLRGLRVMGYVHRDHVVKGAPRHRYLGAILYEQARFNAGVDWLKRTDAPLASVEATNGGGYSFFVTPFFQKKGEGLEALIRYDAFRPDTSRTPDAKQRRVIAGLAYWFPHPGGNATAALLLDVEQVSFKGYSTSPPRQERVFLHGLIAF